MQAWLADQPLLASGDGLAARQRWIEEFPELGQSKLGRALAEAAHTFPGWAQVGVASLHDFYESDLFQRLEPQFRAQLTSLRNHWRSR